MSERNRRWTICLMVVAALNAGLVVYLVGQAQPGLLLIMLAIMAGSVGLTYVFYVQLVTRSTGARAPIESEVAVLDPIVAGVARQFGHQAPRILVLDEDAANAFAVGAKTDDSVICFTTGILGRLDEEQLEAVVAHEMSHIVNGDTKVSLISASLLGWALVVSWIGSIIAIAVAAMGLGMLSGGGNDDDGAATLARIVVGLGMAITAVMAWIALQVWVLMARIADLAIHRQREYLADASAVQTTGNAEALISALLALEGESAVLQKGHALAQPLCVAGDPRTGSAWRDLLSTHPTMEARIERLHTYGREIAQTVPTTTVPAHAPMPPVASEAAFQAVPAPVERPVVAGVQTKLREDTMAAAPTAEPVEVVVPAAVPGPPLAVAAPVEPATAYVLVSDVAAGQEEPLTSAGCLALPLWLADALRFFEARSAGGPELVAALSSRPAAEGGWPGSVSRIGSAPWAGASQGTSTNRPSVKGRFGPGLRPWAVFEIGSSTEPPSPAEVDALRGAGLADEGSILVRHGVIDHQERFRAWQLGQSPTELQVGFVNRPLEVAPKPRDGGGR